MFVYSLRASTLKFFAVVCVALVALITLIAFVPSFEGNYAAASAEQGGSYSYEKIKTNEDRVNFLSQFGWQVKSDPVSSEKVSVPDTFDKVLMGYNEIQKSQGLDLSKYKGKELTRYTYEITNYSGYDGVVYATILMYRNKVVGGDVCSADTEGFIHGFETNNP